MPDADLSRRPQRVADDEIAFLGDVAVGQHVIGPLEIERVDVGGVDELGEFDGVARLQPHGVEFALLQHHIMAGLDLVAHHHVVGRDLALALRDLDVADALLALAVDLVEARRRLRALGGDEADGDRDQREPQIALPEGAHVFGHGLSPLGKLRGPAGPVPGLDLFFDG